MGVARYLYNTPSPAKRIRPEFARLPGYLFRLFIRHPRLTSSHQNIPESGAKKYSVFLTGRASGQSDSISPLLLESTVGLDLALVGWVQRSIPSVQRSLLPRRAIGLGHLLVCFQCSTSHTFASSDQDLGITQPRPTRIASMDERSASPQPCFAPLLVG